jgi:hypothetical protein
VTTAQTRTARIAGTLATLAVALVGATAAHAAPAPLGPPITQEDTYIFPKGAPPCVCLPIDQPQSR